jgi:ubiquinone biosynthesis protein COQ4
VLRDPDDTASGARLVLACEGKRAEENFKRFAAHPRGARILTGGTSLFDLLSDRDGLRKLPAESLGRTYLAFVEREGISTEALQSVVAPVERELFDVAPGHQRYADHLSAMHDLWHVTTGYSRDILGELLLLAFSHEQLGTRAFGWIVRVASIGIDRRIPGAKALLIDAKARAARAPWLLTEDWEPLLSLPITKVRTHLHLGPGPEYIRHHRNPRGFGLIPEKTAA